MRAAVLVGPQHVRAEERPQPRPERGEVLVRTSYVGICGSDQARFWGREPLAAGSVVFGHECSGRVVALGPGVTTPTVGTRVAVAPLLNCGECAYCRAGQANLCPERRLFGQHVDGALREVMAVPADRAYPLPAQVSDPEGALVEPLAVACHAVRRAGIRPGARALVLGAGAIGLLVAQAWKALSGGPVAVADLEARRLAVAAGLGLETWADEPPGVPVSVLFEATGSAQAFGCWLPSLGTGGRAVVVGKLGETVPIDWVALMRKEGEIVTSRYFTLEDFALALQLMEKGLVSVSPLIGRVVPFERLEDREGQSVMEEARQVIRLLVRMQEGEA
ncbi:MAG: zinc-dependent alcohol dehydrogenase [Anaerolineae bacterium]